MKEFRYVNDMGIPKKMVVNMTPEDEKYSVIVWEMLHGEYCGRGKMTKDEINQFLKHYGVDDQI